VQGFRGGITAGKEKEEKPNVSGAFKRLATGPGKHLGGRHLPVCITGKPAWEGGKAGGGALPCGCSGDLEGTF